MICSSLIRDSFHNAESNSDNKEYAVLLEKQILTYLASPEIQTVWNTKVYYHVHKCPPQDSVLK
jgi:hypothetical protein